MPRLWRSDYSRDWFPALPGWAEVWKRPSGPKQGGRPVGLRDGYPTSSDGNPKPRAVQFSGKIRFFGVHFVEKIKTSGSVQNQVAGGFPIYRSINDNVADGWVEPPQKTNLDKTVRNQARAPQSKRQPSRQSLCGNSKIGLESDLGP